MASAIRRLRPTEKNEKGWRVEALLGLVWMFVRVYFLMSSGRMHLPLMTRQQIAAAMYHESSE